MLAFAGVAWAFAEGFSRPAAGPRQWLGDGLGVLAGVLWGATTLAIRATRLGQRLGREDAALPARRLGGAAADRRARRRRRPAAAHGCRRWPGARSRSRPSSSASPATWSGSGSSATTRRPGCLVHDADAGVRAAARRAAAGRADHGAPAGRARRRRGRHLPRQPPTHERPCCTTIAARASALCAAATWLVWRWLRQRRPGHGLPLFGIALARPLLDLASALHRA